METVTMNLSLQVPTELQEAFMRAVEEESKPLTDIVLDLMRDFVKLAEEKKTPLYKANKAMAAGNMDEAFKYMKQLPVPPELADGFKEVLGVDFLVREGFNLSEVEEKYGRAWFTS
jgi:hypothetical protein